MKTIFGLLILALFAVVSLVWDDHDKPLLPVKENVPESAGEQYWRYWSDGNGEVNTYALVQSRYGELRRGDAELVFVSEELSRDSRIKIESDSVPRDRRVPVMKMNRVARFQTGLYDYAVMTSTFAAADSGITGQPFAPWKISCTVNEWCGNYFGMVLPDSDVMRFTRHSYFEKEGDAVNEPVRYPVGAWACEDELPIRIRELRGPWMHDGETREISIWPAFQHQRFLHTPHAFLSGTITRTAGGSVDVGGRTYARTTVWTWAYRDTAGVVRETYTVDAAYPHTILSWRSSDGTSGELLASKRVPYWARHDNASARLRRELGLTSQKQGP